MHCSIVHSSLHPKDNHYIYHFSDVLKQNWAYISCVDQDIIQYYTNQNVIRKKSDNCSVQYKSQKVFGLFQEMAIKSGKVWILYYGPSSHGRGLVDSMSSFGVKTPLHQEIINNDFFWTKSSQLVDLFKSKFMGDRMHYSEITADEINSQPMPVPRIINGCRKLHCIAFHPDSSIETSRDICDCDHCFQGYFSNCVYKYGDDGDNLDGDGEDNDGDYEDDDNGEDEEEIDYSDVLSEGSKIALPTLENVHESFYLCVVGKVLYANEDIYDSYQHFVLQGMQYLECTYLVKEKEMKTYTQYKKLSRTVCVTW